MDPLHERSSSSAELDLSEHATGYGSTTCHPEEELEHCVVEDVDERKIAKRHVEEIRKSKGLDLPEGQESAANIEDLESSLDVLSDQLYSKPTHFLLELIQNADDNSYDAETPAISFNSIEGDLRIACNENGFSPANVEAICRIKKSTKKNRSEGFIGEKGIGFKSVFKIANVVWISSRGYTFKFDRNARLGMIAPIWGDFPVPVAPGETHFHLQLSRDKDCQAENDLIKQLRIFDSTILLFLRKLKKIEIEVSDKDWMKRFTNQITRTDSNAHGGELITIKKKWMKTKKADETLQYFVVRHNTSEMPSEQKRDGIQVSEVVLAFPFIGNKPAFHVQKAYAFLPIRDSGFRVSASTYIILIPIR